ncbi:MAG: mandelate racemase/muconate lactonizing enzyme family protein [Gammaproteobacteria bacterium]
MEVTEFRTLHCDAGWRTFSFLVLRASNGLEGCSEYNASYGSPGLTGVIERLAARVVGQDPRRLERISSELYAFTRQAPGGIAQQAIAAIENALMDLKARALDVPVYELLGGKVRDRLALYWSHCGSYRVGAASRHLECPPIRSLDDLETLGTEVRERGFGALKTNIFLFEPEPHMYQPGFTHGPGWPELNADRRLIEALQAQLGALRKGAGPGVEILLDLNFNFKTEGYLKVMRALDDLGLFWFELDTFDAAALAHIRRGVSTPIASCESLFTTRGFRPYLEHQSVDVAIVDVPWNGIWQAVKIAAMAEAYEVNVAPHNFYGHLSTLMSAHFCAAIPNFRIMEIDIDDVPWKDEIVSRAPVIANGELELPDGPGWGAELVEEAILEHPPTRPV